MFLDWINTPLTKQCVNGLLHHHLLLSTGLLHWLLHTKIPAKWRRVTQQQWQMNSAPESAIIMPCGSLWGLGGAWKQPRRIPGRDKEFLDLPSHIAGHQTRSRSLTWSFQSSLWLCRLSHSDDWNSYTDNVLWGHSDVWIKAMRISHVWVWAHPPLHVPYQQAPEPHHLNRKMKNFAGIRFPSTPCLVRRQIWKNRRVHEARCPFSSITLSSVCG